MLALIPVTTLYRSDPGVLLKVSHLLMHIPFKTRSCGTGAAVRNSASITTAVRCLGRSKKNTRMFFSYCNSSGWNGLDLIFQLGLLRFRRRLLHH